jgi:hypothetical protein
LRFEMAFSDDLGSTQDWLLPEDRESFLEENGKPAADPLLEEALALARASAEAAADAEQRALLAGNESEARMQQILYVARASAEVAVEAEQRASAAGDEAQARLSELTERVELALAKIEARERATRRRAFEAEREEETLRSFGRRADRIVRRLRQLEQAPAILRTVPLGPARSR